MFVFFTYRQERAIKEEKEGKGERGQAKTGSKAREREGGEGRGGDSKGRVYGERSVFVVATLACVGQELSLTSLNPCSVRSLTGDTFPGATMVSNQRVCGAVICAALYSVFSCEPRIRRQRITSTRPSMHPSSSSWTQQACPTLQSRKNCW